MDGWPGMEFQAWVDCKTEKQQSYYSPFSLPPSLVDAVSFPLLAGSFSLS